MGVELCPNYTIEKVTAALLIGSEITVSFCSTRRPHTTSNSLGEPPNVPVNSGCDISQVASRVSRGVPGRHFWNECITWKEDLAGGGMIAVVLPEEDQVVNTNTSEVFGG